MINKETLKNNRAVRKAYYVSRGIVCRKKLEKQASKTLDAFHVTFDSEGERQKRIRDMVRMETLYGFTPSEYLNYRFADKTDPERLEFVADWEHLGYTCALNDPRNARVFDDKWKTYNTFKKYYKREVAFFDGSTPLSAFEEFTDRFGRFIIKPLDLSCGRNIQIVDITEHPDRRALFEDWLKCYNGHFILEQLIVQSPELGKFHPSSVNTVRMPTIRLDEGVVFVHPQLRMGQQGNVVDNAGAGGIKGAIDVETGVVFAVVDNAGNTYTAHPDTGEVIEGFTIPRWEEAKALARELTGVVPENRYTGWDLALTEDGWVLVEANRRAQFGFQMPLQQGFRREINGYLRKLGRKY